MRKVFILFFTLFIWDLSLPRAWGQDGGSCTLRGTVQEELDSGRRAPLEMALVALIDAHDTLRVRTGFSQADGAYALRGVPVGEYRLMVQMVGYGAIDTAVVFSAAGEVKEVSFFLREEYGEIEAARVSASRVGKLGQQRYSFTEENLQRARNSEQLLLTLPFFTRDAGSGIVFSDDRSRPLFLLNGQPSSLEEIRAIPKDRLLRIEYYQTPPYRYRTSSRVIDVVTRELEGGHYGSVNLSVEPVGYFASGGLFYGYHSGRHNVTLQASTFWLRPRRENEMWDSLSYRIPGSELEKTSWGKRGFSNLTPDIALAYTYNEGNRDVFRMTAQANAVIADFWNSHTVASSYNGATSRYARQSKGVQRIYRPTLDAYYLHSFASKGEIFANVVGSYGAAREASEMAYAYEQVGAVRIPDQRAAWGANDISAIAHVQYDQPYLKWLFSVGVISDNVFMRTRDCVEQGGRATFSTERHELRSTNTLTFRAGWLPSESLNVSLLGRVSGWLRRERSGSSGAQRFFAHPALEVTWQPSSGAHWLQYSVTMGYSTPDLTYYSTVPLSYDEGFFSEVNFDLKSDATYSSRVLYRWRYGGKFTLWLDVSGSYCVQSIESTYRAGVREGKNLLIEVAENAKWRGRILGDLYLSYNPLGDARLTLWANGGPRYAALTMDDAARYDHFTYRFSGGVQGSIGRAFWGISAGKNPGVLSATAVSESSWAFYANVGAAWGGWTLRGFLEHIALPLRYDTHSHRGALLQREQRTVEWRKHWAMQLQLSYSFSIGDRYKAPAVKASHAAEQVMGGIQL